MSLRRSTRSKTGNLLSASKKDPTDRKDDDDYGQTTTLITLKTRVNKLEQENQTLQKSFQDILELKLRMEQLQSQILSSQSMAGNQEEVERLEDMIQTQRNESSQKDEQIRRLNMKIHVLEDELTLVSSQGNQDTSTILLSSPPKPKSQIRTPQQTTTRRSSQIDNSLLEQMSFVMKQHQQFHALRTQRSIFGVPAGVVVQGDKNEEGKQGANINGSIGLDIDIELTRENLQMDTQTGSESHKRILEEDITIINDMSTIPIESEVQDNNSTGLSSPLKKQKLHDAPNYENIDICSSPVMKTSIGNYLGFSHHSEETSDVKQKDLRPERIEINEEEEEEETIDDWDLQCGEESEECEKKPSKVIQGIEVVTEVIEIISKDDTEEIFDEDVELIEIETTQKPEEQGGYEEYQEEEDDDSNEDAEEFEEEVPAEGESQQEDPNGTHQEHLAPSGFDQEYSTVQTCLTFLLIHLHLTLNIPFTQLINSPTNHLPYAKPTITCQLCLVPIAQINVIPGEVRCRIAVLDKEHCLLGKCADVSAMKNNAKNLVVRDRRKRVMLLELLHQGYEKERDNDEVYALKYFKVALFVLQVRQIEALPFIVFVAFTYIYNENQRYALEDVPEPEQFYKFSSQAQCADLICDFIQKSCSMDDLEMIQKIKDHSGENFDVEEWRKKLSGTVCRLLRKKYGELMEEVKKVKMKKAKSAKKATDVNDAEKDKDFKKVTKIMNEKKGKKAGTR